MPAVELGVARRGSEGLRMAATTSPTSALGYGIIDKGRYLSDEWAQQEWERVFSRCWLYAVPAQDVAEPGAWATFEIGPEAVLISRTQDGELTAHYNVCQHRGRRLVDECRGKANAFRCKYHAWTYRLDGSLRTVLDPEVFSQGLDVDALGLPEVRVDTWGGLVWVCFDPDTEPLAEYLEVLPEHLRSYALDQYAIVDDQTVEWECNWKVAADAFHETYHTLATHPQMMAYVADINVEIDTYGRHSRFLMPWGAPAPRVKQRQRPNPTQVELFAPYGFDAAAFEGTADEAYLEFQRHKRDWMLERGFRVEDLELSQFSDVYHYTIFPNIQIGFSPDRLLITRHRPHPQDTRRMYFDAQSFAHVQPGEPWPARPDTKVGAGKDFPLKPDFLQQDAGNVPAIQVGLRSRGFRGSTLGDLELRIRHFHSVLDDHMSGRR
jgi:phenylpropionate dioxygenase-like ring-hydroxylating dioxygenase large terminal subunit